MSDFTHLHVHTEYSLLDGAAKIDDLLDAAKNFGMKSLAITDHGTMYGVIDFYKSALKRGIKPIIGCEVYVTPNSYVDRDKSAEKNYYHLILLAENNEGYKNLVKLVSKANLEGFYYRPRVDKKLLREYHGGLIALSACIYGEIPQAVLNGESQRVEDLIGEYAEIFGQENFFLELQNHGLEDELKVRNALKDFSAKLNIPLVATNDSHYVRREDSEFHDAMLCVQTGKKLSDSHRWKFPSDDYYLKSAEEMRDLFDDVPEACDNTLKIAERCNVTLEFGKFQMPEFPLPENYATAADYLRGLCNEKISERYEVVTDEIKSRLDSELEIIHGMGYDGYFLIVHDFISYARQEKIPVGPGRGSAAGSIVAYLLGITDLDPIKYNLLFERFLNPERVTLPDIDVDICYQGRKKVIDYVFEKYGRDKVSQIVTFGTMAAKASIRDITRVLDLPYDKSTQLINMIPNVLNITIDDALKKSKDLRTEYNSNAESKKIIDFARKIEGFSRHISVHAAGVVISKIPLDEIVPLQDIKGVTVTQYDKDKIEELGLLKMDFLGLRTLTIIAATLANIRTSRGIKLEPSQIPLRDKKTAAMLSAGETGAVFQMESAGMTALVKDLRPECFEDLIPTVALYRPGPLGSGMVEDFIAGKHGRKVAKYLHPKLEPILKETFGVILYQEQVMQIVQTLAGFTLGQADILRRAMSKKKADILLEQKENFLRGCESNGVEKSLAEKIFELLTHFADYGFNKSHSAAYGLLAWQTAYLKANFTPEYLAAMMSHTQDIEKVAGYIELSRRLGIKILPPDINLSDSDFTVEDGAIRLGLKIIKSSATTYAENILEERYDGKFKSFANFCERLDVKKCPRRYIERLIKCGAFDDLDNRRTAMLKSLDSTIVIGSKRNSARAGGAMSLFDDEELHKADRVPDVVEAPQKEILAWEKDTLGFYLSGHPLDAFREKFSTLTKCKDLRKLQGKRVKVGGFITYCKHIITKKGDSMAFITIEDFGGAVEVTIFPNVFNACSNILSADEIVVVEGRVEVSGEAVQILANKITAAEDYVGTFWLTVPAQLKTPATIAELEKIFAEHAGDNPIMLNRDGMYRKIPQKISDSSELQGALKNFLGAENVKLY